MISSKIALFIIKYIFSRPAAKYHLPTNQAVSTMSTCSSEYDYISDDEYVYDSDGDDFDVTTKSKSDSMDSMDSVKPLESLGTPIDVDTMQYQWVSLCCRLSETYPAECSYTKPHLSISFHVHQRILTLSVEKTTDTLRWYPNVPPTVSLEGQFMVPNDYLLITCNSMMAKASWNICADINWFIHKCLCIMRETPAIESSDLDIAVLKVGELGGSTFTFESSKGSLPSIGVILSSSPDVSAPLNSYSWNSDSTNIGSLMEVLLTHLTTIVAQLSNIATYHEEIIVQVVHRLMDANMSKLEVVAHESAYQCIVSIVKHLSLDIDTCTIESILNIDASATTDDKIIFVDAFASHSNQLIQPVIKSKFVKRIFAELDSLRDALSDFDGYLMVSESNVQQMKLLLIPDYDTPYGGGYFEFDMFIPNDYPNSPPKMKFLTTGGGSMRFNPNLYNCGKVCLSILGTWAKNQWSPSSSTLSQVVLSVFSMIFIEHPYTNEPGYYNALSTPNGVAASKKYSDNIRVNCAKIAIAHQLSNQATPFKDIIHKHWQTHKERTIAEYLNHGIAIPIE